MAATAAIIGQLDLVISVDTATAHLAGALGKPVWLLLPFAGEWRWLHDRTDSPWYPTMRIFRQPTPGDWRTVLSQVLSALRVESAAGNLAGLEAEGLRLKRSGQFEEARLVFEKIHPLNATVKRHSCGLILCVDRLLFHHISTISSKNTPLLKNTLFLDI